MEKPMNKTLQPTELTDSELDAVSGGWTFKIFSGNGGTGGAGTGGLNAVNGNGGFVFLGSANGGSGNGGANGTGGSANGSA